MLSWQILQVQQSLKLYHMIIILKVLFSKYYLVDQKNFEFIAVKFIIFTSLLLLFLSVLLLSLLLLLFLSVLLSLLLLLLFYHYYYYYYYDRYISLTT